MKHLFNNITQEEKKSILEQHNGGKKLIIKNFNELINKKLGEVKTFLNENEKKTNPTGAWAIPNNNPMALIQQNPQDWEGLKKDSGSRLEFETMWQGVRAGVKNLNNTYFKRGNNTLEGIFKVYAPLGHGKNNPTSYSRTASKRLGVSVGEQLSFEQHGKDLAKIIINVETGIPVGGKGGVSVEDFEKGYNEAISG
jgi:hypothetical protein